MRNVKRAQEAAAEFTRRDLLAGTLAIAAGAVASAMSPDVAGAETGDPVTVGGTYFGGAGGTYITTSTGADGGLGYEYARIAGPCPMPSPLAIRDNFVGLAGAVLADDPGHGIGVAGVAERGDQTGVLAANEEASGVALKVVGRSTFTRSGRGKVPRGKSLVRVTVPGGIKNSSLVLVTLQNAGTGVYLKYAKPDSETQFLVKLSKVATANTYFSWFVIG
ncbi:MAG: hypothetical protein HGB10_06460 [Coriobacteriia bacterium]|nr:hypothetical protein [Coriobacteriia bacterium]